MSKESKMGIRKKIRSAYDHIDKDILLDFFMVFSRFEYALKTSDYISKAEGYIKIDWKNFIEKIKDNKLEEIKHPNEIDLFDERLKKQIIKENEIEWINFEDSKNPTKVECVIHRVITIRNNLFHGAKNTEHIGVNKKRDEKLLLYSIKAIQELVKLEGDVKYNFYDTLP
jgi:hypothetical protein